MLQMSKDALPVDARALKDDEADTQPAQPLPGIEIALETADFGGTVCRCVQPRPRSAW